MKCKYKSADVFKWNSSSVGRTNISRKFEAELKFENFASSNRKPCSNLNSCLFMLRIILKTSVARKFHAESLVDLDFLGPFNQLTP